MHRTARTVSSACRNACGFIEPLEPRALLSAAAADLPALRDSRALGDGIPTNINISRMLENQSEGAVAIDPTGSGRVFAFSNLEFDDGLFAAVSSDGGATWSKRIIADGSDGLVKACCDPTATFDDFGNLYIGYMNASKTAVQLAMSTDGGATFSRLAQFRGDVDQPTVVAGPGSVWVTFAKDSRVAAAGAAVTGLGQVGTFSTPQIAPGSLGGNFGDIAVGPEGQVMITYQSPVDDGGPSKIFINLDRNGLAQGGFGKARVVTSTNVGGFRPIRAQRRATIDAEAGLAYDRSGGVAHGRVYLVYTNASRINRNDTNIILRFSEDDGATWTSPIRVNDDGTQYSQFLPRIAVDQTSGQVAMSWHDSRNDNGIRPASTNLVVNDDAQFYGVVGQPSLGNVILSGNFQISAGMSNAARSGNRIDYGDYTGLAFHGGSMIPMWADNSNSTADNPDGTRKLDMYVAVIRTRV